MDTDSSRTIDRNEALAYWKGKFSAVNAEAMFRSVDKNNDGLIQLNEWLNFWRIIKSVGNSEEEIEYEVIFLYKKIVGFVVRRRNMGRME